MRHIVVDGYNVIRADPRLQSIERESLEQARQVLAQMLASSPRLANDTIVIVFDGARGTRSHVHSHRLGRVVLMYSARGQTADDLIVSQAGSLTRAGSVVVISNDAEVRERCRAEGCAVSGSENLLRQLPGRLSQSSPWDEVSSSATLSTVKRGNPRRSSRRERRQREIRF